MGERLKKWTRRSATAAGVLGLVTGAVIVGEANSGNAGTTKTVPVQERYKLPNNSNILKIGEPIPGGRGFEINIDSELASVRSQVCPGQTETFAYSPDSCIFGQAQIAARETEIQRLPDVIYVPVDLTLIAAFLRIADGKECRRSAIQEGFVTMPQNDPATAATFTPTGLKVLDIIC